MYRISASCCLTCAQPSIFVSFFNHVVSFKFQVNGLTASQVVRLIGLLLVFSSPKIVHNVRNEIAESIVP